MVEPLFTQGLGSKGQKKCRQWPKKPLEIPQPDDEGQHICVDTALHRPPHTDLSSSVSPRASSLLQGRNNPSFLAKHQMKQVASFWVWAAMKICVFRHWHYAKSTGCSHPQRHEEPDTSREDSGIKSAHPFQAKSGLLTCFIFVGGCLLGGMHK